MASIKREAAQALAVDMEAIFTHRQASVARSETLPSSTTTLRDDDLQMNSAIQDDSNSTPSSIDVLGHRVKALVKGVDKLQNLGIETNNLPLPKVIVVGEQSAGKSSVRSSFHSFETSKLILFSSLKALGTICHLHPQFSIANQS